MKIETFKNINDAVNYVLDNNLYHINIAKFEEELMNRAIYRSKTYEIIFVVDANGILTDLEQSIVNNLTIHQLFLHSKQ